MCDEISESDLSNIKKIIRKLDCDDNKHKRKKKNGCSKSESCCSNSESCCSDSLVFDSCSCGKNTECSSNGDCFSSSFFDCDDKININIKPNNRARNPGENLVFYSLITPVAQLTSSTPCGVRNTVEFIMRRKNKTITLQWAPFSGVMAANGVPNLVVNNSLSNLPSYMITFAIYIIYKGVGRTTHLTIDPYLQLGQGNINFFLNTDGSGNNIVLGDSFEIPGGAVTWIAKN